MAIATLPYPDMDFTPLDVLTAEELDHMVANIETVADTTVGTSGISNNAITTAKVADGAITEAKTGFITSSTNRLDIGSWHFYRTTFNNATSGWVNITLNVPNDFNGKIISVLTTAAYGNSGNNYGSTWWNQTLGHVQVRINQTTAGSNGWQALVVAVF